MLRYSLLFLPTLLLLVALPTIAQDGPVASTVEAEATTPASGLAPRQERMLREGRGMGLARAAETNGYPGPMHVLEQAEALDLTDEQRAATAALMARVREQAPAIGARILAAEGELNMMFSEGDIDADALDAKLQQIADLNAELRAVHLQAHINQAALLSEAQKSAYQPKHPAGRMGDERHRMRMHRSPQTEDDAKE